MRIRITLETKKGKALYLSHQELQKTMTEIIYSTLQKTDCDYAKKIHSVGWQLNGLSFKLFTNSYLYAKKYFIDENGIYFMSRKVYFFISSPDEEFISKLSAGAFLGDIKVDDKIFKIKHLDKIAPPNFKNRAVLRTLSPVAVSLGQQDLDENSRFVDRYILPDHPQFFDKLLNTTKKKYTVWQGSEPSEFPLEVKFLQGKEKYIYHENISVKVPATEGLFELKGPPELVKFCYEAGLGEKTGLGFGFLAPGKET